MDSFHSNIDSLGKLLLLLLNTQSGAVKGASFALYYDPTI
jgi:hypothetical protein